MIRRVLYYVKLSATARRSGARLDQRPSRSARVIATSAGPVFPDVKCGGFSDLLYYRINTFTVMLTREPDMRGVEQAGRSAESQSWTGTTL